MNVSCRCLSPDRPPFEPIVGTQKFIRRRFCRRHYERKLPSYRQSLSKTNTDLFSLNSP